ncbi:MULTISPECIES: ECF transporter S component [unclassified Enterococcus]|uniref:ECF transporter S component n=1 Tax=unclassified Enterococcus TaxID=2608891 RepID=UPI00155694B4|nr:MULTISPECIES: ECF transporter S component [unclassified Enterococcus]MBS7578003.1 ECF transporter S component [Enterococcus sp. MMGLQ5-2]MBS7585307.1 ECF transporter S component [Enterococcus sp. MMGLQ5-1]NPD13164.1 ECF transporter S component [Enterococcus sp. MMGLQ5-1]NPD37834.1 ECF transporter S component [Enterococcus sp. MMGLQ5-2]
MSLIRLTRLALLIAACVVLRTAFQWVPNVQPISAIFLILVSLLGLPSAVLVAMMTMLVTGIYMGFGYWVAFQCLAYLIILIGMRCLVKQPFWLRSGYALLSGYFYGLIMSLLYNLLFGLGHFTAYYLSGLFFDSLHAISNFVFYLLLFPTLRQLFKMARIIE